MYILVQKIIDYLLNRIEILEESNKVLEAKIKEQNFEKESKTKDKIIKRPACNVVEIRSTLEKEFFSYSDIEHMQWHLDKIKKEF